MPSATVRLVDGMQFVGTSASGHAIVMDTTEDVGGSDTGPRPMELLLIALGGCTGMDVVSILRKMQVQFTRFEIALDGERAPEYPKYFTKIKVIYKIWGDVPEEKLKKAIDLSLEKYCSVSNSLKPKAEVSYEYQINPT
ncbi:MAG: OsmC family protein [Candidatus Bipolaricaulota bacterium]|nr:OsmC family protein [Candidatus Bipolaricaulota bacterium]MCS7273995.1 OsmC family protein [Candidatus Bipolaricaulota bacterium]MDW8111348.1 OsmC family protein [Candidatus Bipolaricaulota bacterium]MDW8329232.1 OsmC family protein [Candidatus Bipolaricaulota bacterium]